MYTHARTHTHMHDHRYTNTGNHARHINTRPDAIHSHMQANTMSQYTCLCVCVCVRAFGFPCVEPTSPTRYSGHDDKYVRPQQHMRGLYHATSNLNSTTLYTPPYYIEGGGGDEGVVVLGVAYCIPETFKRQLFVLFRFRNAFNFFHPYGYYTILKRKRTYINMENHTQMHKHARTSTHTTPSEKHAYNTNTNT